MTLPVYPSSISLNQINTEFGLGRNLAAYRGVTWYTDAGGTGTFPSAGAISMDLFYGKRATSPVPPTYFASLTTNLQELNLRTWAINNGWNGISPASLTISTGVYVWSDNTSTAALTIDGSWPNGVSVINNGYIMGRGGDAAVTTSAQSPGSVGGPAISLGVNATIVNNGYIGGGGGGGGGWFSGGGSGGGRGATLNPGTGYGVLSAAGGSIGNVGQRNPSLYPGGGGGGRIFPGVGGAKGGRDGEGGGGGGGGGAETGIVGTNFYVNRAGGGGGGWGASGGAGRTSSGSLAGAIAGNGGSAGSVGESGGVAMGGIAGPGGAGGKAISLNGYTATRSGTGITYGSVS